MTFLGDKEVIMLFFFLLFTFELCLCSWFDSKHLLLMPSYILVIQQGLVMH